MSSIRATTPPIFFHVVSEISKKGLGDNKFLEESLDQVESLSSAVSVISTIMTNETNEVGKRDLFNILLHLLSSNEEYDDGFTDDLIIQLISKISTFPYIFRNREVYDTMKQALQNLFKKLSENGLLKIQTGVKLTNSPYVSYVFAVLALQGTIRMPLILGGPQNTIPTNEGLTLFMETNEYAKLDTDEQKAFDNYNMPQIIKSSLQSLSDSGKIYGISLLQGYFHFYPEKAEESCPPLDTVLGYLKKDLLKTSAIGILQQNKLIEAMKGREPKVAASILVQIGLKGEYSEKAVPFVCNNEVFSDIESYIEKLLKSDSTVLGASMVAQEKGLFDKKPDLINIAFPNPVKRMRVAIELIKAVDKPSQQLYEAMLNQAFVAYASSGETRSINNFIDVAANNDFNEFFSNFLLKRLVEVNDSKVLNVFGNELTTALNREQNPLKRFAPSDNALFYKLACHLYGVYFEQNQPIPNALRILTLYKEIPKDLTENDETKIQPIQYINAVIPKTEYTEFLQTAESCINQHPVVVVLCVALPDLDDSKVDSLIQTCENDSTYTPEIGHEFFTLLANNYQDRFFNYLESEQLGKQVTNNIFVNRKKKLRVDNTVKNAMTILPRSLDEKKQTFDQDGQKRLCRVVDSILPRVNIPDFSNEISQLGSVFTLLPDITPEEEEYNTFVDTGFIQQYPMIFRHVENKDDLSKKLITNYVASIEDQKSFANDLQNPEEREKLTKGIEDATNVLFSMNPSEEILLYTYDELIKKHLHKKNQTYIQYKYPVVIEKFALSAEKNKVSLTLPQFANFLTRLLAYTISKDRVVREAAHNAFESLFGVEHKSSVIYSHDGHQDNSNANNNDNNAGSSDADEDQINEQSEERRNDAEEQLEQQEIKEENEEEDGEQKPPVQKPVTRQAPAQKQSSSKVSAVDDEQNHLGNEQIFNGAIDLFERIQVNMSTELLNAILDHIIVKKIYSPATCLFLRAIFQKRENFASTDHSNQILKLFLAQPGMTITCQFHFDKGVMALAERSLIDFIAIFLLSESPYQTKIITYILGKIELRDKFIETVFVYLNTSKDIERSLNLFYILKLIVKSEGNEICPKSFAMLISCIIMWMGALFEQNYNKKINLIKLAQSTSDISSLIDDITSRTVIASSFSISISVNDISRFAISQRSLANIIVSIPAKELEIVFDYVDKVITKSPNQPYILSAGLFSIAMAQGHTYHCTLTDNLLTKVIPKTVVDGFEKADFTNGCRLCYASNEAILKSLNDEQVETVYGVVVEALGQSKICLDEAAVLLHHFLEKVKGKALKKDLLLEGLRNLFSQRPPRDIYLDLVLAYLTVECDFDDFNMEEKDLNVEKFFSWIPRYEKQNLEILRKITESEDIASGLKGKVEDTLIATFALNLVNDTKEIDADLLNLFAALNKELKDCHEEPAEKFRADLLRKILTFSADPKCELKKQSAELIKSLVINA